MKKNVGYLCKNVLVLLLSLVLIASTIPVGGLYSYADNNGILSENDINIIWLDENYDGADHFYEGRSVVSKNGKFGYIDETGAEVVPCIYKYASNYSDGLAGVQVSEQLGFIDKNGEVIIPFEHGDYGKRFYAPYFKNGLFSTYKNNKKVLIDKMGNIVMPEVDCEYIGDFSEGLASVTYKTGEQNSNGRDLYKIGYIDTKGKLVISVPYAFENSMLMGFEFSEGLAWLPFIGNQDGEIYIDKDGNEALSFGYYCQDVDFSNGLLAVQNDTGKVGYINKNGEVVIPFNYDSAGPVIPSFHDGLAAVRKGQKFGFIDTNGNLVVPYKYKADVFHQYYFNEGYAAVGDGYIDKNGNDVLKLDGFYVWNFNEGKAIVSKDGRYGIINIEDLNGKSAETDGYSELIKTKVVFEDVKPSAWYSKSINYIVNSNIMNGVGDNKFNPEGKITKSMLTTMLFRLSGDEIVEGQALTDVKVGSWYENAANWSTLNNILVNNSTGKFMPNHELSREEFVTIIYKYAKYKKLEIGNKSDLKEFTDLSECSSDSIETFAWAVGSGIINGVSSTEISPKSTANRAQMATILMRFIELYK